MQHFEFPDEARRHGAEAEIRDLSLIEACKGPGSRHTGGVLWPGTRSIRSSGGFNQASLANASARAVAWEA
jgi:hypothetical protein